MGTEDQGQLRKRVVFIHASPSKAHHTVPSFTPGSHSLSISLPLPITSSASLVLLVAGTGLESQCFLSAPLCIFIADELCHLV